MEPEYDDPGHCPHGVAMYDRCAECEAEGDQQNEDEIEEDFFDDQDEKGGR